MSDREQPADLKGDDWFVYIVECADGTLYTGITTNLERRVDEHNAGTGARYTRSRRPVVLRYNEPQPDRSGASSRECRIKALSRKAKQALINRAERPIDSPKSEN